MSAQREPTVIERMVRSFWEHINRESPVPVRLTEPLSNEYGNAMLAAVRELYRCQIERGEKYHCMSAACMLEVIEDHERRAGGKGE